MALATVSPFIFDGPLPPEDVVGRTAEAAELLAVGKAGRFVRLYAPRRYGKTSLLGKVAADAARMRPAMPVVTVDLYGLNSMADLTIRLEAAYAKLPEGRFRRAVSQKLAGSGLGFSLMGTGISAQFAQRPSQDPSIALHKILDLPLEAVPDNTRALVVFDEFQSIANVKELAALLRSHIQHQRKKASFVFCGSEQGMLEAIFGDPSKPLYTQAAPMRLGGLPASVLEAMIREKFEQTGRGAGDVLATLVTVAAGHPQRAMLLAHQLWVRTPPRKRATQESWEAALTQALKDARPELETVWSVLTANEQRTLRALTNLGSPYEKRASALLELRRSSAHTAVSALARRGIVESDEEDETDGSPALRIVDPLLSEWIRRRFPWP